jgi:hypothetical protein
MLHKKCQRVLAQIIFQDPLQVLSNKLHQSSTQKKKKNLKGGKIPKRWKVDKGRYSTYHTLASLKSPVGQERVCDLKKGCNHPRAMICCKPLLI